MRFSLTGEQWTEARRLQFFTDLLTRRPRTPGVTNAALAFSLPIDGSNWNSIFIARDKPIPPQARAAERGIHAGQRRLFRNDGHSARRGTAVRRHGTRRHRPT